MDKPLSQGAGKFGADFLTNLFGGLRDKQQKDDASDQFNAYKTGLMSTYQQLMAQNQKLLSGVTNPEGDIQQGNTSVNPVSNLNPMAEYEKLLGLQSNLVGNPYGEQFSKQAENMYNMLLGKNNQPDYEIREINGQLVKYDKQNPNKFDVVFGQPKPEKEKPRTMTDYQKMTLEQVQGLQPNEIENAFYYFTPEVQAELKKNPYFQQLDDRLFKEGDFAKNLKTGGKITGGKINITGGQQDDLTMFNSLDNYNKVIRAGQELTPDLEKNYNTARLTLGQKYNLNDTQLARVIDRINDASTDKERKQIIQSLGKGNYYEDVGTPQEQIDYDRGRILEWKQALDEAYNRQDGSYDGYKQNFLKELQDFYFRGSVTKKEYDDLIKSYY